MNKLLFTAVVLIYGMNNAQIHTPTGGINSATTNPQTGNVGIGTDNPQAKLDVQGEMKISEGIRFYGPPKIVGWGEPLAYYIGHYDVPLSSGLDIHWFGGIKLGTSFGDVMQITGNGNVGVGTNTPQEKLEVKGNLSINLGENDGPNLKLGNAIDHSWIQSFSSLPLYINSLGNNTILNQTGGNVGIGTNTPQEKLEVKGNLSINLGENDGPNLKLGNAIDHSWIQSFSSLPLYINSLGNNTVLNLTAGNVGIGTNNPEGKLDINFSGEPKRIRFLDAPNVGGTMNSMMRFTWYNDTADFGMVRSWDTPIEALALRFNEQETARFTPNGNFALKGKIEAKEIKVTTTPTADFVFAEEYKLPKLEEVEKHIKERKHLPEIASAKEMEKEGVNIGEFQIKLLQKIEELTLYSIEQNKKSKEQEQQLKTQTQKIDKLERMLLELTNKKQ